MDLDHAQKVEIFHACLGKNRPNLMLSRLMERHGKEKIARAALGMLHEGNRIFLGLANCAEEFDQLSHTKAAQCRNSKSWLEWGDEDVLMSVIRLCKKSLPDHVSSIPLFRILADCFYYQRHGLARILIDSGVPIEIGGDLSERFRGDTPIHGAVKSACQNGNLEGVKMLIDLGVDLNREDEFGETPIFICNLTKDLGVAKRLVEAGADPKKSGSCAHSMLHHLVYQTDFSCLPVDAIHWLVENGVDPDHKNEDGYTAYDMIKAYGPSKSHNLAAEFERIVRLAYADFEASVIGCSGNASVKPASRAYRL